MEQITDNSKEDNVTIDNLRQRLQEIPLVHKPINESDHMEFFEQTKPLIRSLSFYSYFDKYNNYNLEEENATLVKEVLSVPSLETVSARDEGNDYTSRSVLVPPDTWLIGGTLGSKNSLLVFKSTALATTSPECIKSKPAYKLHITYKVMQAETKLLAKLLSCHGITEVASDSEDFNLLWTGIHPKPGVFRSLCTHQRINHFPRSYELTRKDRLYKNIERMQHSKGFKNFDFIPQTFVMPGDFKELCTVHYRLRGPWIVKPVASSRGRGIFIVETPYEVPMDESLVVAKYISKPLLIDGHKCDLRLYVAVTSYDPLLIYIYEEGLVRFATVKYDTSHKQLWNPCMHLCNYSINKYHSDYVKSDDPCAENVGHKWTLSALLRHLKSQDKDTQQLMTQIEDIIVKAIITSAHSIISACQMFVPNSSNCFELFGFDILIDEDLKPWLLEVNLSPSLGCDSPLDVRLKSAMLADLLTLVGLPAVDPILKPVSNNMPKSSNTLKMKLGTCRRVHSADGLSQSLAKKNTSTVRQGGRLTTSTLCLTAEETRIVKLARSQFERRGGWVRIFPTADSWVKYSQYLDPNSGIPVSAVPSTTSQMVVQHNYNQLLHTQLFPNMAAPPNRPNMKQSTAPGVVAAVGQRHNRYERQLNRGLRTSLDSGKQLLNSDNGDQIKIQICDMLKAGKSLTQSEARRTFSLYLSCILKKISSNQSSRQDCHIEVVLKFLQKASAYLRTPFVVKIPSSKLAGKDRAAIVAKQLNDFLYLYNRETDLYSDNVDKSHCIPNKLYSQFLETARECDLEEVLTMQTVHNFPNRVSSGTNWGIQGLLKCFPNVATSCGNSVVNRTMKKTGIKVAKPS